MKKTILVLILTFNILNSNSSTSGENIIDGSKTSYLISKLNSYYPECLTHSCDLFIEDADKVKRIDNLFGNSSTLESYLNRIIWSEYLTRVIKKNNQKYLNENNGEDIASFVNLLNGSTRFDIKYIKLSQTAESYLFYIDPSRCYKNMNLGLTYPTVFNKLNHFGKKYPMDTIKLEILEIKDKNISYSLDSSTPQKFVIE